MVVLDMLFCYAATIMRIYISIMTLLMLTYGPARYSCQMRDSIINERAV